MKSLSLLTALVLIGILNTSNVSASQSVHVVIDLPLHHGPSAREAVIGYIPKNKSVDILYCQQRWCKVWYHGYQGWVVPEYLRIGFHSGPIIRRYDEPYHQHKANRYRWRRSLLWDRDFSLYYPRKGPWFPGFDLYFHKKF
jgi:uncharacterized protein YraI